MTQPLLSWRREDVKGITGTLDLATRAGILAAKQVAVAVAVARFLWGDGVRARDRSWWG